MPFSMFLLVILHKNGQSVEEQALVDVSLVTFESGCYGFLRSVLKPSGSGPIIDGLCKKGVEIDGP